MREVLGDHLRASPLVLVDVGASGGFPEHWRGLDGMLKTVGFEPDPAAYEELIERTRAEAEAGMSVVINAALANSSGERELFVTRKQMCSSLLRPNRVLLDGFPGTKRFEVVATTMVRTETMDAALCTAGVDAVDFVKLDTQGTELFILEGGAATLRGGVLGVQVEVEFVEMYQGQPLFGDVDTFLRKAGFRLLDFIGPSHWRRDAATGGKGELLFADAVYLRSSESLFSEMGASTSKLMKTLAIAVLYEHYDYALALLRGGREREMVGHAAYERVAAALRRL